MKILEQNETLILIIDIQEKLLNSTFNKDLLLKNASTITKTSTILNIPVIITEQYPKGLGETISDIKNNVNASFYEKTSFNALEDETLCEELKSKNKKQIILLGIETHICVYQTAIALLEKGFDVTIVKNACGSRSENEHKNSLEILKSIGANIKTTEMILFELLKTAKHPNFKEIQALIK